MKARILTVLFLLVFSAGVSLAALDTWCAHVTNMGGWNTRISIYNPNTVNADVTILRYHPDGNAHGGPLLVPAPGLAWTTMSPGDLAYDGSAHLTAPDDLVVKVSYQQGGAAAMDDLFLEDGLAPDWILPNTVPSVMPYSGLAMVNPQDASVTVGLEVWFSGIQIATQSVTLAPREKFSQLVDSIWPEISYQAFDTIRVLAAAAIPPPVVISGSFSQEMHRCVSARSVSLPPGAGYWAPWVTQLTTTSATINWHGQSEGLGLVDYATTAYYEAHQKFENTAHCETFAQYQHLALTGLAPDTSYTYLVRPSGSEKGYSPRTFRTMPVSGPFTFVVISDSQEGHAYTEPMRFKYVADAIAKEKDALFILHGGDYAGHDSEHLWSVYAGVAEGMLAKFPIFPCIGNHEYHTGGDNDGDLPTKAVQFHSCFTTELPYSFDCAGVRFIVLDSPDPASADSDDPHTSLALAQKQAPWLQDQLNGPQSGNFIIHHHSVWDYGRTTIDANLEPWEALYHTYGISACFSGHTHNYQRYQVAGIPYFVLGMAGGRCSDLVGFHSDWYITGYYKELGYLRVRVDPEHNTATAEAVMVGYVLEDDSAETPQLYDPPQVKDSVTFPLRQNR